MGPVWGRRGWSITHGWPASSIQTGQLGPGPVSHECARGAGTPDATDTNATHRVSAEAPSIIQRVFTLWYSQRALMSAK